MKPDLASKKTGVYFGDAREMLRLWPDKVFHCCVTSPPYFGLRDYGMAKQIGLEQSPEQYILELLKVFAEVKRVLRDDGTFWLNIGDSYAGSWGNFAGQNRGKGTQRQIRKGSKVHQKSYDGLEQFKPPTADYIAGCKPKDLIGIPWMLAFALRASGWYLRQDIIWHKPNPMPESVTDRCTKAHEYIFLLSKSKRYYYKAQAIKERVKGDWGTRNRKNGKYHSDGTGLRPHSGLTANYEFANKRSVWTVATKPYKGAHFATFPADLIRPCILAGCPENGIVLDPFAGSGTTLQVAQELNRNAVGIELNAGYEDLIRKRIQAEEGEGNEKNKLASLMQAEGPSPP